MPPSKPARRTPAGAALGRPPVPAPKKRAHTGGSPAHQPTELSRKTVALAVFAGYTQEQTARLVGIDAKTLAKYYDDELTRGAERIGAAIASNLVSIATQKGDLKASLTASIFLAKARLRWRETDSVVVQGKAGSGEADKTVEFTIKIGDAGPQDG